MARRPVNSPYSITTYFGATDSYAKFGRHSGVDYAVQNGTHVYAPMSGKVVSAAFNQYRGNQLVIFDGKYYHRLCHNSAFKVAEGAWVSEGQLVALSGTTGLSTGPHVHWDVNDEGIEVTSFARFIDPWNILNVPSPTVYLPASAGTWACYFLGTACRKGTSDQAGTLQPGYFGGLSYAILGWENNGYAAIIQTQSFGKVKVWVKDTDAVIK